MQRRTPVWQVVRLFSRRLWLPLVLIVLFLLVSVTVYMALEGLSWANALFWVSHPHAIHPERVKSATKLFALFVFGGVFFFQVWFAERVLSALFAREGLEVWAMIKNRLDVAAIRDHFIVCGYGQVGRTVADQLRKALIPFVLIEIDEGLAKELRNEGFPVIRGDAKRRAVLTEAGIERARGICVVIDNNADNLYISITARSLNPSVKIIMRVGQRRYADAMRSAGADEVVIPEYEGGAHGCAAGGEACRRAAESGPPGTRVSWAQAGSRLGSAASVDECLAVRWPPSKSAEWAWELARLRMRRADGKSPEAAQQGPAPRR